ncbi:MAG: hypothetical protein V4724_24370 [Pseudomonadota bacterium]
MASAYHARQCCRLAFAIALACAALPSQATPNWIESNASWQTSDVVNDEGWLEQPGNRADGAMFTAHSFSNSYLTPLGFIKIASNDGRSLNMHLPRLDLQLIETRDTDSAAIREVRQAQEGNPATYWIMSLGLVTATITGLLMHGRNPVSRKRKYRQNPGQPHRKG